MEFQDHGYKKGSKIQLLHLILKHSFENGWMTGKEKLQIVAKKTYKDKEFELFKLIRSMESEENAARLFRSMMCFNEMEKILNEIGWDEEYLSFIMSKVFDKGLITEEEELGCDSKLSIETPEDVKGKHPMKIELVSIETSEDDVENGKHPMKIELIIRCIFKYLNVGDIRSCRKISKQWSIVGLSFLTSRARIRFLKFELNEETYTSNKTPEGYFETFDEFSEEFRDPDYPEPITFTAFSFYNLGDGSWTIEELNEFFDRQKNIIRELKLVDLRLEDEYGETVEDFDITGWIAQSPLAQPADTKYITKLEIDYEDEAISVLKVSSDALRGIKILKLKNCQVHLTEEKIRPVELELDCVSFFRDLNKLPQLCINDGFDLSNLKKISLGCDAEKTIYELDMTGELSLEHLNVPQGLLRNWDICKWTVQRLDVVQNTFIEKTEMQIKELNLWESTVDLSVLPHSIEKLSIERIKSGTCRKREPFSFDSENLRYLSLSFVLTNGCPSSTISHFNNCSNLTALELENKKNSQYIDISWIPLSVLRLQLLGFTVTNRKEMEPFYTQKLVLSKYSIQEIEIICSSYFNTQELVLFLKNSKSKRMLNCFQENANIMREMQDSQPQFLQRIYVGPFNWSAARACDLDYEEITILAEYVDFRSEYYVFERDRSGRAIDRLKFEKAKEIQAD